MAKQKSDDNVMVIDIKPFIMPITIVVSTLIWGFSFMGGMAILGHNISNGGGTGSVRGAADRDTEGGEVVAGDDITGTTVVELASAIDGVDIPEFEACVAENNQEEIQADFSDGQADGITGTPGFIVGRLADDGSVEGVSIGGAQPFTVFSEVIQAYVDGTEADLNAETYPAASTSIDDDPFLGNTDAEIVLVEFSDYECPFCQRHHNDTYPEIVEAFVETDLMGYVFRDYPLSFHEPLASEAAVAANCVFAQAGATGYYQFADAYFANTRSGGQGL